MFLLDTNIVSALRRPDTAPASLLSWAAGMAVADLYLSAMTLYELELGVRRFERPRPDTGTYPANMAVTVRPSTISGSHFTDR